MSKHYSQHSGKVISTDSKFTHVMAIALDPRTKYQEGVVRCITSREGDITKSGYVDRSELHKVKKISGESFEIGAKLEIENEAEVVEHLKGDLDFIGLEDPDLWIDEKENLLHLYFTLPLINKIEHEKNQIHLGHALGKDLGSLVMTEPALLADHVGGAKELSIVPINKAGIRLNLVESSKKESDFTYSVVRIAIAKEMGKPWKFGDIVFHPKEQGIPWIGGHASPGPLFSKNFMNVGEGKLLGIMNGREANKRVGKEIKYGIFSVGLFIYDYEKGKIDWVSPEPFIRDTEAKTITFASQFVETANGQGILYAHVDDSFVRAYSLDAKNIKKCLP
ncbi:MAG: hypothetical protein WCT02_04670 [Candidatus Paceibacterota bacterium]